MFRWFAGALAAATMVSGSTFAATAPATPEAQASNADKIRCKRTVETGSLAKYTKECHTNAEWQQMAIEGRRNASDMINNRTNSTQNPH